jgi:glycosyltransferase involved in cell wall biosynthesis
MTIGGERTKPRISVVIPAYNEERCIGEAVENVKLAVEEYQKRTGARAEIIVVNNNSTDRTEEVAKAHGAKVVFEGKNNIAASRNAGARAAQGEIVAFLDADDRMSSNLLVLVDEAMSSGQYIGGGVKIRWDRSSLPLFFYNAFVSALRWFSKLSTGLIYTYKETFDRIGGFNEDYYATEETRFVWELKKLGSTERKRFNTITRGYVTKSARKFEELGWRALLEIRFLFRPKKLKDQQACSYWYQRKKSRIEGRG